MKTLYTITMPWGKFKGDFVVEVPSSYIAYILSENPPGGELEKWLKMALVENLHLYDDLGEALYDEIDAYRNENRKLWEKIEELESYLEDEY